MKKQVYIIILLLAFLLLSACQKTNLQNSALLPLSPSPAASDNALLRSPDSLEANMQSSDTLKAYFDSKYVQPIGKVEKEIYLGMLNARNKDFLDVNEKLRNDLAYFNTEECKEKLEEMLQILYSYKNELSRLKDLENSHPDNASNFYGSRNMFYFLAENSFNELNDMKDAYSYFNKLSESKKRDFSFNIETSLKVLELIPLVH